MGIKIYIIYFSFIIFTYNFYLCLCKSNKNNEDEFITKFTIDTYGENYVFKNRYNLEYNNDTMLFKEHNKLQTL